MVNLNVTWLDFWFCFDFVRLHAWCSCCSIVNVFKLCKQNRLIAKWVLKIWIIINKRHFDIFGQLLTQEYKATKKQILRLQLNEKKSKESHKRLMSWYWKRKLTWKKDLITYNSHPWIMFPFNWLVIIWRGGVH